MTLPFDPRQLPPFYTGTSPFLKANPYFLGLLWQTSQRCPVEAFEDIYDAQGFKLWAAHRPLEPELLQKLADRPLRKPIELCVHAKDPVAAAAIEPRLQRACAQSPDLAAALATHQQAVRLAMRSLVPNPQELLLISVMCHGGRDLFTHAVVVMALALTLAAEAGLESPHWRALAHAALLHDVGRLYFPADVAGLKAQSVRMRHPEVGALAAVELAGCSQEVGQLIACSHERLNGSGYPRGLETAQLSPSARILLFAEAMAGYLLNPAAGGHAGVQRAAMAARMVPHEFDEACVSWMASVAHSVAHSGLGAPAAASASEPEVEPVSKAETAPIGVRLREFHAALSRAVVLLSLPVGELPEVRQAAKRWLQGLNPLMQALRVSGVEDALSQGQNLEPASPEEASELELLLAELSSRVTGFAQAWALECAQSPYFKDSRLVASLAQIIQTLAPQSADQALSSVVPPVVSRN